MPNSHQRRAQVSEAWRNLHYEASRIASAENIPFEQAEARVFADPELLAKVHQVKPAASIPVNLPVSPIAVQSRNSVTGQ
jgi:hypothetical protein